MRTWYFTPGLLSAAESWRLLRWCVEHGADEFTVAVRCMADEPAPIADAFEDAFAGSPTGIARRRILAGASDGNVQPVRLWALNEQAIVSLRTFMSEGLFTHRVDPRGWLEDPVIYRNGALMLGVVTHEQEGVLRATPQEVRELETLGFDFASRGEAITY
jgi:hypothetical protein